MLRAQPDARPPGGPPGRCAPPPVAGHLWRGFGVAALRSCHRGGRRALGFRAAWARRGSVSRARALCCRERDARRSFIAGAQPGQRWVRSALRGAGAGEAAPGRDYVCTLCVSNVDLRPRSGRARCASPTCRSPGW
eukprot:5311522-Prymnesium_polylepis.1